MPMTSQHCVTFTTPPEDPAGPVPEAGTLVPRPAEPHPAIPVTTAGLARGTVCLTRSSAQARRARGTTALVPIRTRVGRDGAS